MAPRWLRAINAILIFLGSFVWATALVTLVVLLPSRQREISAFLLLGTPPIIGIIIATVSTLVVARGMRTRSRRAHVLLLATLLLLSTVSPGIFLTIPE